MALVSVIIPVFNGERYVAAALDSILNQTVPPDEVIVVDDGSTDATSSILATFGLPVVVIAQPNCGAATAVNVGVAAARGRFLCFADADDLWAPDKIARQLDWLAEHPNTEAVFGHVKQFVSEDLAPELASRLACPQAPQPGVSKIAIMIRREAFDRIGPFDSRLRSTDFLEWYGRALENRLRADMLAEVVVLRRLHATNNGIRIRDAQRSENLDILKRALDRRRAGSRILLEP